MTIGIISRRTAPIVPGLGSHLTARKLMHTAQAFSFVTRDGLPRIGPLREDCSGCVMDGARPHWLRRSQLMTKALGKASADQPSAQALQGPRHDLRLCGSSKERGCPIRYSQHGAAEAGGRERRCHVGAQRTVCILIYVVTSSGHAHSREKDELTKISCLPGIAICHSECVGPAEIRESKQNGCDRMRHLVRCRAAWRS